MNASVDTGRARSSIWRLAVVSLLVLAVLGFGLASLCGAAFTLMSLGNLRDPYIGAVLVVALPSLLIGGGMAWLFLRALRKRLATPTPPAP